MAAFDRNDVFVLLKSKYGDITIETSEKHGFEDIVTLHADISQPSDSEIIGTDVILGDVSEENIEEAKALFLRFSSEELVESTDYGEVYKNTKYNAFIYINGVKVAEEENFLLVIISHP